MLTPVGYYLRAQKTSISPSKCMRICKEKQENIGKPFLALGVIVLKGKAEKYLMCVCWCAT